MRYFKHLHNVFCIPDDILVAGYDRDGEDHDDTLQRVLQTCRQVNLKLNKDKCHFRCTQVAFFGEVIFRNGVKPDLQKTQSKDRDTSSKNQKRVTSIPWNNKLSKQVLSYHNRCMQSTKTSVKTEWTWNATYQKLFDRAKSIIKADACMKFHNEPNPLYLETAASGVGLGSSLLQKRNGTSCPRDAAPGNNILWPLHLQAKVYPLPRRDTAI